MLGVVDFNQSQLELDRMLVEDVGDFARRCLFTGVLASRLTDLTASNFQARDRGHCPCWGMADFNQSQLVLDRILVEDVEDFVRC